jgi:hypothetical protein|eukprot:g4891.t1
MAFAANSARQKEFEKYIFEDLIASLSSANIDIGRRKYLAEKLFPVVFEALPKLLRAVEKNQQCLSKEKDHWYYDQRDVRPINPCEWLAQYLYRHNPKYKDATISEELYEKLNPPPKPASTPKKRPLIRTQTPKHIGEFSLDRAQSLGYALPKQNITPRDDDLRVGDKVVCKFAGKGHFYPGTISSVNKDGTFGIDYADGDWEDDAQRSNIKKKKTTRATKVKAASPPPGSDPEEPLRIGDKVTCNFSGKGHFYPGTVVGINVDGTYQIEYADGDWEDDAKRCNVKKKKSSPQSKPKADSSSNWLKVGDKVRANFAGKGHFYPGTISSINADGTYGIEYADGDWEDDAQLSNIEKKKNQ